MPTIPRIQKTVEILLVQFEGEVVDVLVVRHDRCLWFRSAARLWRSHRYIERIVVVPVMQLQVPTILTAQKESLS